MIDATPNIPLPVPATANKDIKVATPDLIQFDESNIPIEYMTDLLFENIGGQEIISISRNDTISGQRVIYNPIKNVAQLGTKFNPLNLFVNTGDTDSIFRGFPIKFDEKVPEIGTNPVQNEVIAVTSINDTNGNLEIEVIGMLPNEQVEVQVLASGNPLDGIIY
jgi:hypothetical protein